MDLFTDCFESPIGYLKLTATSTDLVELKFIDEKILGLQKNSIIEETIFQLQLYFKKELKEFTIPIHPNGSAFRKQVWKILHNIPFGELKSYKEVAIELGSVNYVRAVGLANGNNPIAIIVPCHRVIGSDNSIVGYSGGIWRKRWFIEHENAGMRQTLFDLNNIL